MSKLIWIICLFFFSSHVLQAQKYDFKLNLDKEKTYSQTIELQTKITNKITKKEVGNDEVESEENFSKHLFLDNYYKLLTTEKNANSKYSMFLTDMLVKHRTGNAEESNSIKDVQDLNLKVNLAENLKKFSIKLEINPQGKIISRSSEREHFKTIVESDIKTSTLFWPIYREFTGEVLTNILNSTFNIFPDKTIEIGDTWTKETVQNTKYNVKKSITYTYIQEKNNLIYISLEGRVIPLDEETKNMGITSYIKGTVIVDKTSGWVTSTDISSQISLTEKRISKDEKTHAKIKMKVETNISITGSVSK